MSTTYNLFVYGTLRRGFHNHGLMKNAKHICDGTTLDRMRLVVHSGHGIPFTWKDDCGHPLRGEFYEIQKEDIKPIHYMEVSAGYDAEWVSIILDNGRISLAIIYLYPPTENKFFIDVPQCDYSMYNK